MFVRRTTLLTALLVGAGLLAVPTAWGAGWISVVDVSDPTGDGINASVAVGPDGSATAAWLDITDTDERILVATRPAGAAAYSTPVPLSTEGVDADSALVFTDSLGTTTVLWREGGLGAAGTLRARTRPAGSTTFGPADDVSVPATGGLGADIDADAQGNTTVVWYDGGSGTEAWAATRAAGASGFGDPDSLEATDDANNPAIDVTPGGAAAVAFSDFDGDSAVIGLATRTSATADFEPPEPLQDHVNGVEFGSADVLVDRGAATVVWRTFGTDAVVEVAGGPLGGPYSEPKPLSAPGSVSGPPQVATDGQRDTVVWSSRTVGETNWRVRSVTRAAGATTFGPAVDLSPVGQNATAQRVVGASGRTTVAWEIFSEPNAAQAVTRSPGAETFGAIQTLETTTEDLNLNDLATAPDGEATVAWRVNVGEDRVIRSRVLDSVSPAVLSLAVPERVRLGVQLPVSATVADHWSGVTTTWDFGDGAGATGTSASHAYKSGGAYAVRLTVTDAVGNQTTRLSSVVVAPPPKVISAALAKTRFRTRTRLQVRTSEPGRVRMLVQRCRTAGGRKCVRWPAKGTRVKAIGADLASYKFPARIGGHRLKPGRYRVVVRMVAADGVVSHKKTRAFRVLPR